MEVGYDSISSLSPWSMLVSGYVDVFSLTIWIRFPHVSSKIADTLAPASSGS
jgi:hypothetical protein